MQSFLNDDYYMKIALEEAKQAATEGEIPIGAVIVRHNRIIARDHNRKEQLNDPTAHAEMLVIQKASMFFPSWRIENATLFVTLEPCPMCAGAILQARINRVVFGTDDPKAGAVISLFHLLSDERLNHRCEITPFCLQNSSIDILRTFFRKNRQMGKK
ncbi:MAG: tRNA adenosine(34) deaminase TadA [Planctomycetia bacterium]|nr:tRNA adenosine(34) deaminase TadA [Planctomycetia bacterium]